MGPEVGLIRKESANRTVANKPTDDIKRPQGLGLLNPG